MAKIPGFKRIFENDYPEESRGVVGKLAGSLNYIIEIIVTSLNNKLTFTDNMQSTYSDIVLELNTNGTPKSRTTFKLTSDFNPLGCIIIKVDNLSNSTYPSSAPFVTWEKYGNNIEIKHITGLAANTKYKIRFLAFS